MAQETEDSGADTSHQLTTCHMILVDRRLIRRAMREVDVDDALQNGRDDTCQLSRTEHVAHATDCDEIVRPNGWLNEPFQTLMIPMLVSEGHTSWQEESQLMKAK